MNNETDLIAAALAAEPPVPSPQSALMGKGRRASDEALLAYCDSQFSGLMNACLPTDNPAPGGASSIAPPSRPDPGKGDPAVLARYQDDLKAGRPALSPGLRRGAGLTANGVARTREPLLGLGPRVYAGFDFEWVSRRAGRNGILSGQFFVIGPTGETLQKVIHLNGDEPVQQRPRLGEVLCDLLEEAEEWGAIEEWPGEVVLCGFFTRADITVFSDFRALRPQLDGVGGTLVTIGKPAELQLPLSEKRQAHLKARYNLVVGDAFDPRILNLRLVDASRLAPPGKTLASIGLWLGIPKLELPPGYSKDGMRAFQRDHRKRFEAYGLRDAEIAVTYVLWVVWFATRYLGLDMARLSATASGLAVRLAEACIRRDGVALDVALNYEQVSLTQWDNKTDRARSTRKRVPKRIRRWLEPFLADAYLGGRNECYRFGPTERKRFYDPDLSGAYSTGLGYLFVLDYDRARMTEDPKAFVGHVAGFALVKFAFPAGTRFPCLPVAVPDRGLFFPLRGDSLCTAPEIELALQMGAELEIQFGLVIPWLPREQVFERRREILDRKPRRTSSKGASPESPGRDLAGIPASDEQMAFPPAHHGDEGYRLFESFAIYARTMRNRFRRKSLPFEFMKLCANSLYGKTGQGFKGKRAFGPREMGNVVVGPSRVSEAAVASLTTGFLRAVLGEILWKLPLDAEVVSATTDGFLVDKPLDQLDLTGTMCGRFKTLLDRLSPGSPILENKHQVMQIVAMRTRGQITGEADGDHDLVVAKAGVKPGPGVVDENAFMLDLFLGRQPGQKVAYESFISMRDQLTFGRDLQTERRETKLNLEFDFKRRPLPATARMVEVSGRGVSHLAFDTAPWDNVEEAAMARVIFGQWRQTHCLKTEEDLQDFLRFLQFKGGNRVRTRSAGAAQGGEEGVTRGRTGQVNMTRSGYLGAVKRTFLAAYVQRTWGLDGADLSQRELSDWLGSVGYETTLSAVKNGTRARLNERVAPATEEVMAFLRVVKGRFPGLEIEHFLFEKG